MGREFLTNQLRNTEACADPSKSDRMDFCVCAEIPGILDFPVDPGVQSLQLDPENKKHQWSHSLSDITWLVNISTIFWCKKKKHAIYGF